MATISNANVELQIKNIEKALSKVPDLFIRKSFEGVLRKAGNVFKNEYKTRLPVVTGNLKNSITTKVFPPEPGDPSYAAVVYAKRPKGSHAHLIEHGWNVGKRGPTGSRVNRGQGVPIESGSPVVAGKPYFLEATKAVEPKIAKIVSDAIVKELDKVFGK